MQTARLVLRPLAEGDLDGLVELDGFEVVRAAVDPFGEHIPDDPAERREYERRFLGREGFRGALERSRGRLVGWFQFESAGVDGRQRELGYRLRPDAWGQGFATEGARALLMAALEGGEVDRVYAHALTSNAASIGVMERIGMRYVAPWEYRGLPGVEYEARPRGEPEVPGTGPLSAPAKRP